MKERLTVDRFVEIVIVLIKYCSPALAAIGFLHLFLCNHDMPGFWKAVLYVAAFTLGLCSFVMYDVTEMRVKDLEEELKKYKQREV